MPANINNISFEEHLANAVPVDGNATASERACALALHTLGEPDRAWLLARFPNDTSIRVSSLLEAMQPLRTESSAQHKTISQRQLSKHLIEIKRTPTNMLAQLLASEPPEVIAHCASILSSRKQKKLATRLQGTIAMDFLINANTGDTETSIIRDVVLEQVVRRIEALKARNREKGWFYSITNYSFISTLVSKLGSTKENQVEPQF